MADPVLDCFEPAPFSSAIYSETRYDHGFSEHTVFRKRILYAAELSRWRNQRRNAKRHDQSHRQTLDADSVSQGNEYEYGDEYCPRIAGGHSARGADLLDPDEND